MPSPGTKGFGPIAGLALVILGSASAIQAQEARAVQHAEAPAVAFPVSCGPEGRAQFERGVALLHSVRWEEAGERFREIAAGDSACAMAAWGIAMALRGNPFAGEPPTASQREAWAVLSETTGRDGMTPRERDYLEAITAYFRDSEQLDHAMRSLTYEVKMRDLAQRYPDDLEARVFYTGAAAANAVRTDTTLERRSEIGRVLDSLQAAHPTHPGVVHALVHVYDHPALAPHGLEAARRVTRAASDAGDARHLASHLYARLGMWDEVVAANEPFVEGVLAADGSVGAGTLDEVPAHALDLLVYAYLQQGRDREARGVIQAIARIGGRARDDHSIARAELVVALAPARDALERGDWAAAAVLPVPEVAGGLQARAVTRFARALAAARTGDVERAGAEFDALLAIERSWPSNADDWRRRTEAQRLAVSAWVAFAGADTASALLLAAEAADREDGLEMQPGTSPPVLPARELQGDLLVEMGRFEDARSAYEAVLHLAPNRARSLFGAAWSAQLAGDHDAADDWYRRYLALTRNGDGDRPEVMVAGAYVPGYARGQ